VNSGLFPFADYWWLYLAFTGLIGCLLAFDLTNHRKAHAISFAEATLWTSVWIALALAFSYALYRFTAIRLPEAAARQITLEFLTGYVVEESLSIDNMFVFALIFRYFAVPGKFQHRVLFYGVLGAMICRAIFIGIGSALIRFDWIMTVFGIFLIFTGIRMAWSDEKRIEPDKSPVIRLARRFLPVTPDLHEGRFFARVNGVWHITPLMFVLLFLETTDVMFAVDSVPAVFAVTREPFVVYTSNVFAILGLRAMYFMLAGAMDRFYALKYGLGVVLVFGGRFPIGVSLGIIAAVIALSIVFSLVIRPGSAAPLLQRGIGAAWLLLAATGFLFAIVQPVSTPIPQPALYLSAACYAFGGFLILRASTSHR
jgi:tellurite resistance protein TerC